MRQRESEREELMEKRGAKMRGRPEVESWPSVVRLRANSLMSLANEPHSFYRLSALSLTPLCINSSLPSLLFCHKSYAHFPPHKQCNPCTTLCGSQNEGGLTGRDPLPHLPHPPHPLTGSVSPLCDAVLPVGSSQHARRASYPQHRVPLCVVICHCSERHGGVKGWSSSVGAQALRANGLIPLLHCHWEEASRAAS